MQILIPHHLTLYANHSLTLCESFIGCSFPPLSKTCWSLFACCFYSIFHHLCCFDSCYFGVSLHIRMFIFVPSTMVAEGHFSENWTPTHLWCLDVFHILLTVHKSVVVKLREVVVVWTTTTITLSDFHSVYLSVFLTAIFFSFRGNAILSFLPLFVSKIFLPSVYLLYFLCLLDWSAWQNNKQIHFSDGLDATAYFPLHRLIL